jgi:predicted nucleotide-binding protein (sugar kinase/HSP70/actin superfamily)
MVSKGSFWDGQSNGADAKCLDKISAGCFHNKGIFDFNKLTKKIIIQLKKILFVFITLLL